MDETIKVCCWIYTAFFFFREMVENLYCRPEWHFLYHFSPVFLSKMKGVWMSSWPPERETSNRLSANMSESLFRRHGIRTWRSENDRWSETCVCQSVSCRWRYVMYVMVVEIGFLRWVTDINRVFIRIFSSVAIIWLPAALSICLIDSWVDSLVPRPLKFIGCFHIQFFRQVRTPRSQSGPKVSTWAGLGPLPSELQFGSISLRKEFDSESTQLEEVTQTRHVFWLAGIFSKMRAVKLSQN